MSVEQTKLVDVTCRRPIRLRNRLVRGMYHENLTIQEIADCIAQYAKVEEILPTGEKIVLDYTNYDKNHAPVEAKTEPVKEAKKEEPVVEEKEETTKETELPETTIKDEDVVEDADEKLTQAKKQTGKKK